MDNQGTFGELLLDTVEILKTDRDELVSLEDEDMSDMSGFQLEVFCARVALSVEFSKRNKGFQLKAIVEDWNHQRTIREMY